MRISPEGSLNKSELVNSGSPVLEGKRFLVFRLHSGQIKKEVNMGWLMLVCHIIIIFFLVKIFRFIEWLVNHKENGVELVYSELPEGQIMDVLIILNKNKVKCYE